MDEERMRDEMWYDVIWLGMGVMMNEIWVGLGILRRNMMSQMKDDAVNGWRAGIDGDDGMKGTERRRERCNERCNERKKERKKEKKKEQNTYRTKSFLLLSLDTYRW